MNIEGFNVTNYREHPSNDRYWVFFFKDAKRATDFEAALTEQGIWFEKDREEEYHLYGVHKDDFKAVQHQNFMTEAKFRKPFMADPLFRWLVVTVSLGAIILAIIGAALN